MAYSNCRLSPHSAFNRPRQLTSDAGWLYFSLNSFIFNNSSHSNQISAYRMLAPPLVRVPPQISNNILLKSKKVKKQSLFDFVKYSRLNDFSTSFLDPRSPTALIRDNGKIVVCIFLFFNRCQFYLQQRTKLKSFNQK